MDNEFDKKLDFDSDTFEDMKQNMNFVLQRLLGNMQEKGSTEGSMTIKIDIILDEEFIPNYDPNIEGENRKISKPQFKHKVTSVVKISDEKSGSFNSEMEMVMDEDTGVFKLIPVANTQQRTIFDSDFMKGQDTEEKPEGSNGPKLIEGGTTPLLPGEDVVEGEYREINAEETDEDNSGDEPELGKGLEDITDELLGDDQEDDEYGYEEPEGE